MAEERVLIQRSPWPVELELLVADWRYRPGWTFTLHESLVREHVDPADFSSPPLSWGTTLDIITWGYNSYHLPDQPEWRDDLVDRVPFWVSETCRDCGEAWPCTAYRYDNDPQKASNPYRVHHYWPVPPATFNRQSWRRWLFDRCMAVEQHEACEFAAERCQTCKGERTVPNMVGIEQLGELRCEDCEGTGWVHPYAPNHGPGNDPYIVFEYSDVDRRRTSFKGQLKAAPTP